MSSGSGLKLATGVYAALLTPRERDCTEADAARLLDYLDKVSNAGVNGLVFFGSTGEFVHFDLAERMRVLALAVKRSRVPVLVNVSHSTLAGSIALAEQAAAAGASGLLLMPPYFYRVDDGTIAEFYAQFVKGVGRAVPIYLYNLPQSTAPLSEALVRQLLSSSSFAGIKDSGGEWPLFESMLKLREDHSFQLLVGNESVLLRALRAGADGSVSGVAASVPELPVALYRAVKSGDEQTASTLSMKLEKLMMWIEKLPPLIALKQIAEVRSWVPFTPAIPLDDSSKLTLREFCCWLEGWLPATLDACAAVSEPSVRG